MHGLREPGREEHVLPPEATLARIWLPSLEPVTTGDGQKQISIPGPTGRRFFRLSHP